MTITFSPAPKLCGRLDADEKMAAHVQMLIDRKKSKGSMRQRQEAKLRAMTPEERQLKFAWKNNPKAIPQVNRKRQARRSKEYAAHIGSAYWKSLRAEAYKRDGGVCWCPDCVQGRKDGVVEAFEPIAIWFDVKGGIHGFETHHTTYVRFGRESLEDVLTMWPAHHRRLEAKTGMRKRFLRGKA